MRNFGFKIIDVGPNQVEPIIDYAVAHGRPVEVGIYYGNPAVHELLCQRLVPAGMPVNAHTNHERCHVFNFDQTLDLLEAHIRQACDFGSAYSVVHLANMPLTSRAGKQSALMAHLLENLERAQAVCVKYGYRLHVENAYDSLGVYRRLFEGIIGRRLEHIHFCFDIGHAKVWSAETLDEWLAFLDDLNGDGIRLHIHLHANRGLIDEHLALAEAEALGICGPDDYFNADGYPGAYRTIGRRFPDAVKVFEVKHEQAIANLEAVVSSI